MYMPVSLFLEGEKRKEKKFALGALLLSTFAFEPLALRMARMRIFFGLAKGIGYEETLGLLK
jgi:hypothetical protein